MSVELENQYCSGVFAIEVNKEPAGKWSNYEPQLKAQWIGSNKSERKTDSCHNNERKKIHINTIILSQWHWKDAAASQIQCDTHS